MRRFRPHVFVILGLAFAAQAGQAQPAPTWGTLPDALEEAQRTGRVALVYVSADWCAPCRRMEQEVFPQVEVLLRRLSLAGLVIDDEGREVEWMGARRSPAAWARELGADSTPAFIFLRPDGELLARAHGYMSRKRFALLLSYVETGAHRHVDFATYEERTTVPDRPY